MSQDHLFLLLSCAPPVGCCIQHWTLSALFWKPMGAWRAVQCPATRNPTPAPIHVGFILGQGGCGTPELTHLPCQPYHSALGVCWILLTFPVLGSLGEWRLMWAEAIGLYHLCAEAVQAGSAAPPSPALVCNCAGRVVVLQPGAKPEEANGAATGLRRAPCQKCVLDLMTRVLFQTSYRGQSMAGNFPLSSS